MDIRDNGSVDGDITSPRVAIAEGAHFRGSVDMQRAGAASRRGSRRLRNRRQAAQPVAKRGRLTNGARHLVDLTPAVSPWPERAER